MVERVSSAAHSSVPSDLDPALVWAEAGFWQKQVSEPFIPRVSVWGEGGYSRTSTDTWRCPQEGPDGPGLARAGKGSKPELGACGPGALFHLGSGVSQASNHHLQVLLCTPGLRSFLDVGPSWSSQYAVYLFTGHMSLHQKTVETF